MLMNWRVLNEFFAPDGTGGGTEGMTARGPGLAKGYAGQADGPTTPDVAVSEDKTVTLTEKELQSRIDRAVTQAVETREHKLAEEHRAALEKSEREKLEAEGNYKALAEKFQGDLDAERQARVQSELRGETAGLLAREEMSAFSTLFDKDLSTLEGRVEVVTLLKAEMEKAVVARVEEEIKKRLGGNDLPPGGKHGSASAQPDVAALYPSMGGKG